MSLIMVFLLCGSTVFAAFAAEADAAPSGEALYSENAEPAEEAAEEASEPSDADAEETPPASSEEQTADEEDDTPSAQDADREEEKDAHVSDEAEAETDDSKADNDTGGDQDGQDEGKPTPAESDRDPRPSKEKSKKDRHAEDDTAADAEETDPPQEDAAEENAQPAEAAAASGSNTAETPRMIIDYAVRHYKKIKKVLWIQCKSDDTAICEYPGASSPDRVVASLSRGAVVRLIDKSDPSWWFVETKDPIGRIARGYAESGYFKKVSFRGSTPKEDPAKVSIRKISNANFGAVEKTTYDELALPETISETREDLVNYGLKFLGNPYKKNGESLTEGSNSSGFARAVYEELSISIPRKCAEQARAGKIISSKDVSTGDLIFYKKVKDFTQAMICLSNDGKGHIRVLLSSAGEGRIVVTELDQSRSFSCRTYDGLNARRSGEVINLSDWTKVGTCRLTSYCYSCNTPANSAATASGIPASEWHTVAVDASVIPLGSKVYIEGYGIFAAEDTGVRGNWCDLYVYGSQCSIWDLAEVYYLK